MLQKDANERNTVFHPIEVQLRLFFCRSERILFFLPFRSCFPYRISASFSPIPTLILPFLYLGVDSFVARERVYKFLFLFGHRSKLSPTTLIVFSSVLSNLSFRFLTDCLSRLFFIRNSASSPVSLLSIPGFCWWSYNTLISNYVLFCVFSQSVYDIGKELSATTSPMIRYIKSLYRIKSGIPFLCGSLPYFTCNFLQIFHCPFFLTL